MKFWVTYGVATFPVLATPLLVWPLVVRRFPILDRSYGLVLAAMVPAAVAIYVRRWLEHLLLPSFVPGEGVMQWASYWLGLLVARVAVPPLRSGAFAGRSFESVAYREEVRS
jgi:hypothetical protein